MDVIIMGKDLHVSMPEASIYSYLKWWRPSEKNLKKNDSFKFYVA